MKWRIHFACLVLLAVLCPAFGIQKEYSTGRLIEVEERYRDRVLLYQVNTPIMTEDPYYVVSVQVGSVVYEAEYLPRDIRQPFPGFWEIDDNVLLRVDKHFLYLKRPDGTEAKFLITGTTHPPADKGSQ
jgi:hypothetical protein